MELPGVGLSENNLNSRDRVTDQRSSEPVVAPLQDSSDVKIARDLCQPSVVCQTSDRVTHVSKQSIHLFTASFQKSAPRDGKVVLLLSNQMDFASALPARSAIEAKRSDERKHHFR